MRCFNFLVLIGPQVNHAKPVLLASEQFFQLRSSILPGRAGLGDCIGGEAGEAIEEDALLGLVETGKRLSLRVDEGELGGELAKNGDSGGLIVHENSALTGGEDFATEDDFVAFGVDPVLFKDGFG